MDELSALKERAKSVLRDFSGEVPKEASFWDMPMHEPARADLPVPGLVLFLLRDVLGFPWAGRGEKVRWSVYCTFRGEPLAFELRKFGFTVRHSEGSSIDLSAALEQLKRAVLLAEGLLERLADEQAAVGNVTIRNLFHDFENRYRFFRENADEAYATPDPPLTPIMFNKEGKPTGWQGTFMQGPRHGSYYTGAMIDAFFSRLEHELVLVLPFVGFDPKGGALRRFIGSTWDQKFKAVFDVSKDAEAKRLYDALKGMKERLRNPLSHGGFEKGWASLYFHMPRIGAIPASLTRFRDSARFHFLPVEHEGHKDICALFDDMDRLFATSHTRMGHQHALSGLDVAFDDETRRKYEEATRSDEEFEEYLERQSRLAEMHANMDY